MLIMLGDGELILVDTAKMWQIAVAVTLIGLFMYAVIGHRRTMQQQKGQR